MNKHLYFIYILMEIERKNNFDGGIWVGKQILPTLEFSFTSSYF